MIGCLFIVACLGASAEEVQEAEVENRIAIPAFFPENWTASRKQDFRRNIVDYRENCTGAFAMTSCRIRFTIERAQIDDLLDGLKKSTGLSFNQGISGRLKTMFFGSARQSASTTQDANWWRPSEREDKTFLSWTMEPSAELQEPSHVVWVQISESEPVDTVSEDNIERCDVFVVYQSD